ncbi:MAG: aminotransferase class V-fold PLP-dependent enzyme [Candidatus Poribacteria bacterium]|nr:aminotransferase class V-fold PLP-dependent enzyme [Candidatus Poribacteria bacterium]
MNNASDGKLRQDWRSEFPVTETYIYMNHAGVAPLSRRVREAMAGFIEDATVNGAVNTEDWAETAEVCRGAAAQLINADPTEIAFMKNTTQGILIAANGIDWQEGDNVVTTAVEFPANVYPWWSLKERYGVQTRMVPERDGRISIEDIAAVIDTHTRALTISHVEFASGFRNDIQALGELCREHNIWFIVDAIQSLGAIEVDVKSCNVDILAADGHKWLLAPEGAAIFYCADEKREQLINTNIGWASVVNPRDFLDYDLTQKPDATRFEEGSYNSVGLYGLNAAIDLLLDIGIPTIETHILELTVGLIAGLEARGYRVITPKKDLERAGIVIFESAQHTPAEIYEMLHAENIITAERGSGIRVSPHFYNTTSEVERLLEVLPDL